MLSVLAFCAAVSAVGMADDPPSREELLRAYEGRAAKIGRDAGSQVSLALWCDAHGLEAERVKHLARAVLINPNHAAARALLGIMSYAGKWRYPEEVAATVQRDEKLAATLAEYNGRRELPAIPQTASGTWLSGAAARPGGRGQGALHRGHAPRPPARGGLDPPRLQAPQRPLADPGADPRRKDRGRAPVEGRSQVAAQARGVSTHPGGTRCP